MNPGHLARPRIVEASATAPLGMPIKPLDPGPRSHGGCGQIVKFQLKLLDAEERNLTGFEHTPAKGERDPIGFYARGTHNARAGSRQGARRHHCRIAAAELAQPAFKVGGRAGHDSVVTEIRHE